MSHYVYFGDMTIYGVEAVDVGYARPVTVYNGVGLGEYPIPDDEKLTEWTVKGQWTERDDYNLSGWKPAHELAKDLRATMKSDDPLQLVIYDGSNSTSKKAYLTDVSMNEKYAGVYEFTVKFTEYKKATVRVTGVPTITRPGKMPEMPKTVVFEKTSDVAEDALNRKKYKSKGDYDVKDFDINTYQYSGRLQYVWVSPDGVVKETTNPNLVPLNTEVTVKEEEAPEWAKTAAVTGYRVYEDMKDKWFDPVKQAYHNEMDKVSQTFNAMSKAIEDYKAGKR